MTRFWKSGTNTSKSYPKGRNSSFWNWPNIWVTLIRECVTRNFQKSPNLVTLYHIQANLSNTNLRLPTTASVWNALFKLYREGQKVVVFSFLHKILRSKLKFLYFYRRWKNQSCFFFFLATKTFCKKAVHHLEWRRRPGMWIKQQERQNKKFENEL